MDRDGLVSSGSDARGAARVLSPRLASSVTSTADRSTSLGSVPCQQLSLGKEERRYITVEPFLQPPSALTLVYEALTYLIMGPILACKCATSLTAHAGKILGMLGMLGMHLLNSTAISQRRGKVRHRLAFLFGSQRSRPGRARFLVIAHYRMSFPGIACTP